jgi:hypothetical protein
LEKNLTMFANSDVHHPTSSTDWTADDHRTLTLVFAKARTPEAIREALAARRTVAWRGNELIGRKDHLAPLFGACVHVRTPHHASGERVWTEIENRCELDIALERVGKGRPAKIDLPARATSLVRFKAGGEGEAKGLPYRAVNFRTGPSEALAVKLVVPSLRAEPDPKPAAVK